MPEFRLKVGGGRTPTKRPQREVVFSPEEKRLLRDIGGAIRDELLAKGRSLDWLSLRTGIARSAIIKVKEGQTNVGILTLNQIVQGLGYTSVFEFLETVPFKRRK